jgi:hypothetical protein
MKGTSIFLCLIRLAAVLIFFLGQYVSTSACCTIMWVWREWSGRGGRSKRRMGWGSRKYSAALTPSLWEQVYGIWLDSCERTMATTPNVYWAAPEMRARSSSRARIHAHMHKHTAQPSIAHAQKQSKRAHTHSLAIFPLAHHFLFTHGFLARTPVSRRLHCPSS